MEQINDDKDRQPSTPLNEVEVSKSVKDYWFFWGPSLVNLVIALLGFKALGLPGLVTASISIVVGIIWAITKDRRRRRQGLYIVLSGVVAWLIGFSICGFILANSNF